MAGEAAGLLGSITGKAARRVIGLSSGTSMDGMDAVLVTVGGRGPQTSVEILAFETLPYRTDLRKRLLSVAAPGAGTAAEVCRLNAEVGEAAAEAAHAVARRAGVLIEEVDLIGSHGQTICHLPDGEPKASLQIGEAAVVAERTGVTTVSNFRARDLAAGGEGAPLVPYVDWLLFRSDREARAMLNLGGIANVTFLPKSGPLSAVRAYDTGPANLVMDGLARALSGGQSQCDTDGRLATSGRLVPEILDRCLEHPYFRRSPPKSTGREAFGDPFVDEILLVGRSSDAGPGDLLATATELTARTVAEAILGHSPGRPPVGRVVVSGGGVHNPALMDRLHERLMPIPVVTLEALGIPPDAKEALAFAVLANESVHGIKANVPGVTGARRSVVLGEVTLGRGHE